MQRKSKSSMPTAESSYSHGTTNLSTVDEEPHSNGHAKSQKRTPFLFLALLVLLLYCSRTIYHFQYDMLPVPLDANQAGKRGFSEKLAIEHVKTLTKLGPHPIGSDALGLAMKMLYSFDFKFGILQESSCSFSRKFLLEASEKIKKEAHWEVDVQVDHFHAKSGANRLVSGLFKGRTLVYSDLEHVVLRILPKYLSEAEDNAILVSSHIDTVFSTEGAGDCTSCVAVMLELARGISHWAHGFKHAVIFLFNIGEEEGLNGAHSFITQHPWKSTIRFAIDLEAMGIGGKSSIFQSGIDPWAIESFAAVAKYPSGQIIAQDLFLSGAIKSATDFQIYSEVAGLPGLDFAYSDASAVYHTKNDKLKLLKPGSLQHLGENILAFLLHAATSAHIPKAKTGDAKDIVQNRVVFFDILGMYMVVYRQNLANMLHNSVILQSLLIWIASLVVGGTPAAISLCLSCLSIILMWLFSLGLSILVAFILPLICSSPVPYIASPWLVVGLFGAPAVLGATIGQHLGYLILQKYLWQVSFKRMLKQSLGIQADLIKWEAQRCLFKAGFVQWFVLLILGNFYNVGSSYIAIAWLVSPAFAYGLIEATLSPVRAPRQLKTITLLLGLTVPVLISAGSFIRLAETLTGIMVRFERNPGGMPEWLGSAIIAIYVSSIVCLTLVYLLSYVHHSGAKKWVILASSALFGLTLAIILVGIVPPFTDDVARAVNVVHVVDKTGISTENNNPISYVSLSSTTPGKFMKELDGLKDEGFACGKEKILDLVTFTVHYGCLSSNDTRGGWSESDIPTLQVERDSEIDVRVTLVSIDAKTSTRWSLAINTEEIEDFKLEGNSEELVPVGNKTTVDGWHIIQFSGGKNSLTQFGLTLFWHKNRTHSSPKTNMSGKEDSDIVLKLRTDINRVTPKIARVLDKLPSWCSLFGKSTSPYTLAFLTNLQVDF